MDIKIFVTLGPGSFSKDVIEQIANEFIYLFRINLSHTPIRLIEEQINFVQSCTEIPLCLDSEGAQMRNQSMSEGKVLFKKGDIIKIHYDEVVGDSNNISFTPNHIVNQFRIGDEIAIDFNMARLKIIDQVYNHFVAKVVVGGKVGSNKAADLNRKIKMDAITDKDKEAIKIGRRMGIRNYALSFAENGEDVKLMRELAGNDVNIISKIESKQGLVNIDNILDKTNEIIIDRGDLSRQILLEKIPFIQRRITSQARAKGVPVAVATNLLESMIKNGQPTRAEINDVVSTLLTGATGLVLAAETAIGSHPVESVKMVRTLINQFERWTPNTTISELLGY